MSNENRKEGKIFKTVLSVALVGAIVAGGAYVYNTLIDDPYEEGGNNGGRIVLADPIVSYDEASYTYDWQDVDGADYYSVDVNGTVIEVEESEYFLIPTEETTTVSVQANADDGLKYKDSGWSESITVRTDLSSVSLSSVIGALNDNVSSYDCSQILSIYFLNDYLCFEALGTSANGTEQLITYTVSSKTGETIESMEQFLEKSDEGQLKCAYFNQDYVSYSSLESFIKSGEAATIQNYIDQGYTCSVVSEAGVVQTETRLTAYGTICLEKGTEKIYISVNYDIYLDLEYATYEDEYKFTTLFENSSNFALIKEKTATVLEGDFTDIFEEMLTINNALDSQL